ncbi:system killer suppression protein [Mesorhizobium sp. M1050]|uniref:system killer suppression protein n=1 Tax=Mesorhizobium sp. M1050 TaxID=2957051 RepID=UPI00333A946F
MDIEYATTKLEKLCLSSKALVKEFGTVVAGAFQNRHAFLAAAPALADVPTDKPFRRHLLEGDRKGQWSVAVKNGICICLVPDHDPVPEMESGGIDLKKVTKVRIIYVGDYH